MMINFLKKVAVLVISSSTAYASSYVSVSSIHTKIKDPDFKYLNKDSVSLNVGYSYEFKNKVNVALQTNRLNSPQRFNVVSRNNGATMQSKSKVNNDTFLVGYRLKRLSPSIFISNTQIKKTLSYQGEIIERERKSGFVYGASLNYFITRHVAASLILVEPKKEFYLRRSLGVGINYIF